MDHPLKVYHGINDKTDGAKSDLFTPKSTLDSDDLQKPHKNMMNKMRGNSIAYGQPVNKGGHGYNNSASNPQNMPLPDMGRKFTDTQLTAKHSHARNGSGLPHGPCS